VHSKPVWEASPRRSRLTVRFTVYPITDSTYHIVRPLGRRRSTETLRDKSRVDQEKLAPARLGHSLAIVADENHGTTLRRSSRPRHAPITLERNGDRRAICLGRSPTASKAPFSTLLFNFSTLLMVQQCGESAFRSKLTPAAPTQRVLPRFATARTRQNAFPRGAVPEAPRKRGAAR
jgi:hypothetical protein